MSHFYVWIYFCTFPYVKNYPFFILVDLYSTWWSIFSSLYLQNEQRKKANKQTLLSKHILLFHDRRKCIVTFHYQIFISTTYSTANWDKKTIKRTECYIAIVWIAECVNTICVAQPPTKTVRIKCATVTSQIRDSDKQITDQTKKKIIQKNLLSLLYRRCAFFKSLLHSLWILKYFLIDMIESHKSFSWFFSQKKHETNRFLYEMPYAAFL